MPVPPRVSTAPKAPEPISEETHQILTVSDLVRLFKVTRTNVPKMIEKYGLKQNTKTRYYVPLTLIEEMRETVKQTPVKRIPVPAHSIGAKYDAARRTIAADVARAFNKLGTIPSYNDYLAWADRSLEFANKDAFLHYFSDWDAALISAGVIKAPAKPIVKPIIRAVEPEPEPKPVPLTPSPQWEEIMALKKAPKTLAELKAANPTIDPALVTRMHELAELGRDFVPVEPHMVAALEQPEPDEDDEVEAVAEVQPEPAPEPEVQPEPVVEEALISSPEETDHYDEFDFFQSTPRWTPIDPVTKQLNYENLRLLSTDGWYANTVIRVDDIAGCSLMAMGQILGVILSLPQHQFLFETRDVKFFNDLNEQISWEPHMYVGFKTKVMEDDEDYVQEQLDLLGKSQARIRFINSDLMPETLARLDLSTVDWVIAGAPCEAEKARTDAFLRVKDTCYRGGKAFFFKGWYGGIDLGGWLYRYFPKLTSEQINAQASELLADRKLAFKAANTWSQENDIKSNFEVLDKDDAYSSYKTYLTERSYEKGGREPFGHIFSRHDWDIYVRFFVQKHTKG